MVYAVQKSAYSFIVTIGYLYLCLQTLYTAIVSSDSVAEAGNDTFTQIRIHPYFSNLSRELNPEDELILKTSIGQAVGYISALLSTSAVKDTLILPRDGCRTRWFKGANSGRCSNKRKRYLGEFCLKDFKIPDEHLEEFITWSHPKLNSSHVWFERGKGVKDTDFVLYVQAITSASCVRSLLGQTESRLIAYSSHCKHGYNDRPIAGYINFCPSELHQFKDNRQKYLLTILHEIIHSLGFSLSLFPKFKNCRFTDEKGTCSQLSPPFYRKISDIVRVLMPNVVKKMKEHLNCSMKDFGAPLQVLDDEVQSHWDSFFMQGSIMAPTLGLPSETFIDIISLSLLEDSGWYKVNYSLADNYPWGKHEGCDFGIKDGVADLICEQGQIGCNFLYTHKAECLNSKYRHGNIFKALDDGSCSDASGNNVNESGEIFGQNSFCFLSSLRFFSLENITVSNMVLEGRCYQHRFKDHDTLEVRVQTSDWMVCEPGKVISNVSGYSGSLKCPVYTNLLHHKKDPPLYLSQDFVNRSPEVTTADIDMNTINITNNTIISTQMVPTTAVSVQYNRAENSANQSSVTVFVRIVMIICTLIHVIVKDRYES